MAKIREDNADSGREREVRQQKLPLSWRAEAVADAPPPVVEPATAADPDVAPPTAEDVPAAPAAPAADEPPQEAPGSAATAAATAVAAPVSVQAAAAEDVVHVAPLRPAFEPTDGEPVPLSEAAASGGVGDLLLSARADSGFSIEEASARTRIPRDIIEHLECNACGQLPPEYYCSAHVEKLSALYNVDPKPILDRLHEDMLAHRGAGEGLGHFHAVMTDSESGAKISYVPPGPGSGKRKRAVSLTGAIVSGGIALLLLVAVAALVVQRFRNRDGDTPAGRLPAQVVHKPPVELKEFIVTEELNAYELPVPAK